MVEQNGKRRFQIQYRMIYLPPYHPQHSPIEFAWVKSKTQEVRIPLIKLNSYSIQLFSMFDALKNFNSTKSKKCN
ncbi:hypothetical protein TTHERM_001232203 (macronuclear) [Tetrahymena thermophila SB210]|uniref:Uncharacterized protein n=1 Tax=Tetrahymena thermophila (strain SB210) TaxID=312017 RepID=W7X4X5_TETTS|nr:hypothetical protein TTHERM_001232203 [Tetrahymena thermophila SB210]EWS71428.1 hypothetical protein TTHERM_001232203 [Tetrahymena thermophila SB210]|eukprot:XP_012656034.1 hypothetical protein TTHERM_001232203 [Tetrahymena thermophila SB210]